MKLTIVNCSSRENNGTSIVVKKLMNLSSAYFNDVKMIDLYDIYTNLSIIDSLIEARIILWICPEYNSSFTSNLKYAVENIGVENFQNKLNGIISTSAGPSSRAGLHQTLNLIMSMESTVVPPGIEWNNIFDDGQANNTPLRVKSLLSNIAFFADRLL